MAFPIGAALGFAGSLLSSRGAKSRRPPTTTLSSFGGFDQTGLGGQYVPGQFSTPGSLRLSYGDYGGLASALPGFAGGLLDEAGQSGFTPGIEGALGNLYGAAGQLPGRGPGFGFERGMVGNALGNFADVAGPMSGDYYNNTLSLLRQQAQPFERQAYDNFTSDLFNRGQLGQHTGGLLDTSAFARGLGQADTDRQLSALGESRAMRGQDVDVANQLFGNTLMGAQFGMGSRQQQFANRMNLQNTAFGQGQNLLGTEVQLAGLPQMFRGTALGQLGQILGFTQGLQGLAMNPAQFGLNAEQAAANARIGSASNQVAFDTSPLGTVGAMGGGMALSQLGSALMGDRSLADIFRGAVGPGGEGGGVSYRGAA